MALFRNIQSSEIWGQNNPSVQKKRLFDFGCDRNNDIGIEVDKRKKKRIYNTNHARPDCEAYTTLKPMCVLVTTFIRSSCQKSGAEVDA